MKVLIVALLLCLVLVHQVRAACRGLSYTTYNCYYGDNNYKWCYLTIYDKYHQFNRPVFWIPQYNDPNPLLGTKGLTTAYVRGNWYDINQQNQILVEVGRENDQYNQPLQFVLNSLCYDNGNTYEISQLITVPDPVSFSFCLWYIFCPAGN